MSDDGGQDEAQKQQRAPMDKNLQRSQAILDRLNRYGVGLNIDVREQAERRAILRLLIAKGIVGEPELVATVHAIEADMLSSILQQVENERLKKAEAAGKPQPVRGPDLILPERMAAARQHRRRH